MIEVLANAGLFEIEELEVSSEWDSYVVNEYPVFGKDWQYLEDLKDVETDLNWKPPEE
jgi:hypothetical protein